MMASDDESHLAKLVAFGGKKFVRASAIFGPNGTGKTTILLAIRTMAWLVTHSKKIITGYDLPYEPHLLNQNKPSTFACWFEKNGIRFYYEFSFDPEGIKYEGLFFVENNIIKTIYERKNSEISFFDREEYKPIALDSLEFYQYSLILSHFKDYGEDFQCAYDFFANDIVCFDLYPEKVWSAANAVDFFDNTQLKNEFLKIIQKINPEIQDVLIELNKTKISKLEESSTENVIFEFAADSEISDKAMRFDPFIKIKYKNFSIPLTEESLGMQKLFLYLCPILDCVYNGKVFICDELVRSFHPILVNKIFELFQKNIKSASQIICTTHNSDLLDLKILRKDQVWFTELTDVKQGTSLFSLSDIKDVADDEDIRLGYLEGMYGGVPENIFESLLGADND